MHGSWYNSFPENAVGFTKEVALRRRFCVIGLVAILLAVGGLLSASGAAQTEQEPFCFALLLWGACDDRGWSQAQYEAGKRMEEIFPRTRMLYLENVNPADRPGLNIPELCDGLVVRGAKLIIAESQDMRDGVLEASRRRPNVCFVHIAGDAALTGTAGPNFSNLMLRMYQGHMIAGLAAALTTKSGKIGYVGPKIDPQGRRRVVAAYLGARYGWRNILRRNPKDLEFEVSWIGSWLNIPGVTADPSEVTQTFFDSGHDVVISGIDTPEALLVAARNRKEGKQVWAIPNDYKGACSAAPKACLGVPFLNWAPGYAKFIRASMTGTCKHEWLWLGADWKNINDPDGSSVGFVSGPALNPSLQKALDAFVDGLARGEIQHFRGPLNYQHGSLYLKEAEVATDKQIWYMKHLLHGMKGPSNKE